MEDRTELSFYVGVEARSRGEGRTKNVMHTDVVQLMGPEVEEGGFEKPRAGEELL